MLSIQNLSVNYGESTILRDIDMEVAPGQVVCLMGRNGVGKTTLMKAIMGILRPKTGTIHFEGEAIQQWPTSRRVRAGIGYVPQGRGIFPLLTVYENLLMGFEATRNRRIDGAALEEVFQLFPVLRDMRGRAAGTLSGGQQQQLAFARVLVRKPRLLLLDEPTEGIQPSIMDEIEDLIRALQQKGEMSILLVEQFLDFALSVGNAFYVMETGAIVMQGTPETFNTERATEYLAF